MWEWIQKTLETSFFGNSVQGYLSAVLIVVLGIVILNRLKKIFLFFLRKNAEKRGTITDTFLLKGVEKSIIPLMYIGVVYAGLSFLQFSSSVDNAINVIFVLLFAVFALRFLTKLINFLITAYWVQVQEDETKVKNIKGLMIVIKLLVWGIGIVLVLDNLGYKVSAIVAGLGIGGIAVALAAQAVLGDLFSYFSIMFDKPFEVGDFIIIDQYMGTVENIGIKTTRIRSLSGEELIFSNSDLTSSRVRNYKRMPTRRVVFKVGVTYNTPKEKLEKIGGMIQKIIEEIEDIRFDRSNFASYGDFSLDFETVYIINNKDYNLYMAKQEEINLKIYEAFKKEGIEFAYPTQTLYLNKS